MKTTFSIEKSEIGRSITHILNPRCGLGDALWKFCAQVQPQGEIAVGHAHGGIGGWPSDGAAATADAEEREREVENAVRRIAGVSQPPLIGEGRALGQRS